MRFRSDTTLELYSLCGIVIFEKSTEELEREGFLVPTKCTFIDMHNEGQESLDYNAEYTEYIVNNNVRNRMIADLCKQYSNTKKILVLTRRIKHAEILHKLINNSTVITGSTERKARKAEFKRFKENNGIVLIGSAQIFSAGIDVPNLDIIINGTGHKSSISSVQIIGRVKRKVEGKKCGYFIDFDDKTKYLKAASEERKKILRDFGNRINEVDKIQSIAIE